MAQANLAGLHAPGGAGHPVRAPASNAIVSHVLVDPNTGNASGVRYITRQHSTGLGNSSGVLGHYLMDHCVSVLRCSPLEDEDRPRGGPEAFHIPRFRNLSGRARPWLRDYGMWGALGRGTPMSLLLAHGEMLPRLENAVRLDPDVLDQWGLPVLRIECSFSDNERQMLADAKQTLHALAEMAGVTPKLEPGLMVHEVGTARMGRDPKTSVVNAFGQCWDIPNLFIVDGACWPTAAYQNPTVTMMAFTSRACAFIQRFLKGQV